MCRKKMSDLLTDESHPPSIYFRYFKNDKILHNIRSISKTVKLKILNTIFT